MKQVYFFEPVVADAAKCSASTYIIVKSSREKAIGHCRGEFDKPWFTGDKQNLTVSVNGTTVGWITKKMVQ